MTREVRPLVFLGTPIAAATVLSELIRNGFEIAHVVTRADARRGRGSSTTPSPVKQIAIENSISVSHDMTWLQENSNRDLLGVVVAYGKIIPSSVLSHIPMVNIHFSLLPRWRGAAPVERAILAGDMRTGVCIMNVEETLDTGDVFARHEIDILGTHTTEILTADTPFGLATNFSDFHETKRKNDVKLHYVKGGKRGTGYVSRDAIEKNKQLLDKWKVLVPEAHGGQKIPDSVLGKPWLCEPESACTQTFLTFWVESELQAKSVESYYRTKFFRHLVSLRKITQHALNSTYSWVPQQSWDQVWTDEKLYKKYGLNKDEIAFIESMIKPMELDND